MQTSKMILAAVAVVLMAAASQPAHAARHGRRLRSSSASCKPCTTTFNFTTPALPNKKTSTWTFTSGNASLTVSGFDKVGNGQNASANKPHALYYKKDGEDETGLGLQSTPNNEIGTTNFVQVNCTSVTPVSVTLGSLQGGENGVLFGSFAPGVLGTNITTIYGSNSDEQQTYTFTSGDFKNYTYLGVSTVGTSGNVNALLVYLAVAADGCC